MKLTNCKLLFGGIELSSRDIVSINASGGKIEIVSKCVGGNAADGKYVCEKRYTANLGDVEFVAD